MKKTLYRIVVALSIVLTVFFPLVAEGQQKFSFSSQNSSEPVKLSISFAEGKTVYRIGEPIKINLSFTATQPGYSVEQRYSPRFDEIIITPKEGVYDWLYKLNRHYSYDHTYVPARLSENPTTLQLFLNEKIRFDKAGKYKIKIISKRVYGQETKDENNFLLGLKKFAPISSNEIEFEVKEMSEAQEKEEVARISKLLDSAKGLREYQPLKRELDYLTGDVSTVEKVKRFLNPPVYDGVRWLDSGVGLNIARNKKLALEILETAFRNTNQEINQDLIRGMVTLRQMMKEDEEPTKTDNMREMQNILEPKLAEMRNLYLRELFESLSKRTGSNKLNTAFIIFNSYPKLDKSSDLFLSTKVILMENFDNLANHQQSTLLDYGWNDIKTPALIPSLVKILSKEEPKPVWSNKKNALKRLIELDKKRARPFVVEELQKSESYADFDILTSLDDEFLPEADDALLQNIRKSAPINVKNLDYFRTGKLTLLIARYATKKIYKDLLDIYKNHGSKWQRDAKASLLGYFMRHNEKEGIQLLEESLKADKSNISSYLYDLTKSGFSKGLERFLQEKFESDNSNNMGSLAYYLAKYGGIKNKKLIEKKHEQWLKEWGAKATELNNPQASNEIKAQTMNQVNLIEALILGKSWKLTQTEINQLKLMCISSTCRQHFSIRYLNK